MALIYNNCWGYITLICIYLSVSPLLTDGKTVTLSISRRVPVVGEELTFTCSYSTGISGTIRFKKDTTVQGACSTTSSTCSPPGNYNFTQDMSAKIVTLQIVSVDKARDTGSWSCENNLIISSPTTLSQFASVLNWTRVIITSSPPKWPSLPESVSPETEIDVTVTTPCAEPPANFTWSYQEVSSGPIEINPTKYTTTTDTTGCPPDQVKTINTLSLPASDLSGKKAALSVTVEHPSFDPADQYKKHNTASFIQFTGSCKKTKLSVWLLVVLMVYWTFY